MKVSTLGGKPLISGTKVVVDPGTPCACGDCGGSGGGGNTGACCKDGVCSVTTPDGCDSIGGRYVGNGTTCTTTICACSETDPPILVALFENIVTCSSCVGDFNGSFELTNFDVHQWGGAGPTIICDGEEHNTLITVTCNSGNNNFQVVYVVDPTFQVIFGGAGFLPVDNTVFCVDLNAGEGGTASIFLP